MILFYHLESRIMNILITPYLKHDEYVQFNM